MIPNQTRAVQRTIALGASAKCENCGTTLRGNYKHRPTQIICNVFEPPGTYRVQVKQYCPVCYDALGRPYGEVIE